MARATEQEEKLAESLQARGGLSQFRSVSERPREKRDSPFGAAPATISPMPAKLVEEKPIVQKPEPVVVATPEVEPVRVAKPRARAPKPVADVTPDPNTENVTVPLSRSLRDRSEELARVLNRNRTIRKTRITRNTILRVALQCILDDLGDASEHSVNSEEELLELARSFRRK